MKQTINYGIDISTLKEMVNKWMQREHGSDDVDYFEEKGGEEWLVDGLKTDLQNGIKSDTIQDREAFYGTNRKE